MVEGKRRYKPDVRKAQIIEVTKRLILEKGLAWATVTRITKSLNISKAALYYHFKNRREILLAILKEVLEGIPVIGEIDDVLAFIRRCSISFFEGTLNDPRQARLFFELLCAPPDENLRDDMHRHLLGLQGMIEATLRKGIAQGHFREDTDTKGVSWEFMSLLMTTFLGSMTVTSDFISMQQALNAVNRILDSIRKH